MKQCDNYTKLSQNIKKKLDKIASSELSCFKIEATILNNLLNLHYAYKEDGFLNKENCETKCLEDVDLIIFIFLTLLTDENTQYKKYLNLSVHEWLAIRKKMVMRWESQDHDLEVSYQAFCYLQDNYKFFLELPPLRISKRTKINIDDSKTNTSNVIDFADYFKNKQKHKNSSQDKQADNDSDDLVEKTLRVDKRNKWFISNEYDLAQYFGKSPRGHQLLSLVMRFLRVANKEKKSDVIEVTCLWRDVARDLGLSYEKGTKRKIAKKSIKRALKEILDIPKHHKKGIEYKLKEKDIQGKNKTRKFYKIIDKIAYKRDSFEVNLNDQFLRYSKTIKGGHYLTDLLKIKEHRYYLGLYVSNIRTIYSPNGPAKDGIFSLEKLREGARVAHYGFDENGNWDSSRQGGYVKSVVRPIFKYLEQLIADGIIASYLLIPKKGVDPWSHEKTQDFINSDAIHKDEVSDLNVQITLPAIIVSSVDVARRRYQNRKYKALARKRGKNF